MLEARAAAQPNQHRRPAQHDNGRSRRQLGLVNVQFADVAQSARDHDRLVIAAPLTIRAILLERARK